MGRPAGPPGGEVATSSAYSEAFKVFHRAILERKQITCTYKRAYREICPHILGHSGDVEMVLVFQFAGETTSILPPGGEWRCFQVSEIKDIKTRNGHWHSGTGHRAAQKCVEYVYIDVNTAVPNQPGRR